MPTPKKPATCPAQKHSYFKGRCVDCNQEKPASAEHSPLPWEKKGLDIYSEGAPVGKVFAHRRAVLNGREAHANAALIVQRVNQGPAFDAMREAQQQLGAVLKLIDRSKLGLLGQAVFDVATEAHRKAALVLADELTKSGGR